MNPVIGETWVNVQFPFRRVNILRLMRGEHDKINLRVVYEYIDSPTPYQDTVEHFTDHFEKVAKG